MAVHTSTFLLYHKNRNGTLLYTQLINTCNKKVLLSLNLIRILVTLALNCFPVPAIAKKCVPVCRNIAKISFHNLLQVSTRETWEGSDWNINLADYFGRLSNPGKKQKYYHVTWYRARQLSRTHIADICHNHTTGGGVLFFELVYFLV